MKETIFLARRWFCILIIGLGCLCWSGCIRHEVKSAPINSPSLTETDIRNAIKTNAPKDEIVKRFGPPLTEDLGTDGTLMDIYVLNTNLGNWDDKFSGLQVYYKSNRVVKWNGTYGSSRSGDYLMTATNSDGKNIASVTLAMELFIVSEEQIAGGKFIDTEKLPRLGYIASEPDLSLHGVKCLLEKDKYNGNYEVHLEVENQDIEAINRLTSANVGKRMLVCIDHKPLIAAMLMMPISNGQLNIWNLDENDIANLGIRKLFGVPGAFISPH